MEEDQKKNLLEDTQKEKNPTNDSNDCVQFNLWFWLRTMFVLAALSFVIVNAVYGFVMPNTNVDCLLDKTFEVTAGFNKYLQNNVFPRHIIIAISSLCVDFVIVYMSIHWALWGKTWRMIFSLAIFYMLRAAVQNIFQMKYPEGYLWENPGFPSLTISYLKTNDFFFSGHVGFPIIIAMECQNLGKTLMSIFCFITCAVEAFTMIVTRGHYSIDLLTGLIVSHYVYIIVEKHIHIVDNSCIGMNGDNKPNQQQEEENFKPVPYVNNNTVVTTNPTTV